MRWRLPVIVRLAALVTFVTVAHAPAREPSADEIASHRWRFVLSGSVATAIAVPCQDCSPDAILQCPAAGRGLMRLTLPVARVANGRIDGSKQIRLSVGAAEWRHRAITPATLDNFTPVIEFGRDDPLFGALIDATDQSLLRLSFYGQHRSIGLAGAAEAIGEVRQACEPEQRPTPSRHCIWAVVVECAAARQPAAASAAANKGAFVRRMPQGHCVMLASPDLARAKLRATSLGGHVERHCLP